MKKKYLKTLFIKEQIPPYFYFFNKTISEKYFPDRKVKILEIGIGSGVQSRILKNLGYEKLYGIDLDDEYKTFLQQEGIDFKKCDLEKEKIPYGNNMFDIVICSHVIEHVWNYDNLLSETNRVLKPSGIAFIETPNFSKQTKTFYSDGTHVKPYLPVGLANLMRMYNSDPIKTYNTGNFWIIQRITKILASPKKSRSIIRKANTPNKSIAGKMNFSFYKTLYNINKELYFLNLSRKDFMIIARKKQ
jgi:2-polyprenyl-3-methyl-5-hydroxy-6-metoxy-1,4-benzoquinol methylase